MSADNPLPAGSWEQRARQALKISRDLAYGGNLIEGLFCKVCDGVEEHNTGCVVLEINDLLATPPSSLEHDAIEALQQRLNTRLNDYLVELRPDYDDSITGFNEAWDVIRKLFREVLQRAKEKRG